MIYPVDSVVQPLNNWGQVRVGRKVDNAIQRYHSKCNSLARVVRKDSAVHWTNHYPVDSVVCFVNTYPLDSDLSSG